MAVKTETNKTEMKKIQKIKKNKDSVFERTNKSSQTNQLTQRERTKLIKLEVKGRAIMTNNYEIKRIVRLF